MSSVRIRNFGKVMAALLTSVSIVACSADDDTSSGTSPTATSPVASALTTVAPSSIAVTVATTSPTSTTTAVATQPTGNQAPGTDAPSTAPPATQPPTVPPPTEAPTACVAPVGTDTYEDGYPNRMSALVGSDIRTGAHECFERVVIELAGSGDVPGVRVDYVDDPVALSPSDETVEIKGDATLVISLAAWMPSMEGAGYDGPTDFSPTNVTRIREVRQIENFEGMTAWAIGLDKKRDFVVSYLDAPHRIVVDIASA